MRRRRRTEHPRPGRRPGCGRRRCRSREPDPCARLRPGGRARPRLQRRLPCRCAARGRRVRRPVSRGGRRRGRLLAAPGSRRPDRVRAGGDGLAPPPWVDPRLSQAAAQLRPRRGDAGAQVAGALHRRRPRHVERPDLWRNRAQARGGAASLARLSRRLGKRAVPVALRAAAGRAQHRLAHARGLPRRRLHHRPRRARRCVGAALPAGARADPRRGRARRRSDLGRYGGAVSDAGADHTRTYRTTRGDGVPPTRPAAAASRRPDARGANAVAAPRRPRADAADRAVPRALERGLGRPDRARPLARDGARGSRSRRPSWKRLRHVGPRGPRRDARGSARLDARRGARRGAPARPLPVPADVVAPCAGLRRAAGGARRRSRSRRRRRRVASSPCGMTIVAAVVAVVAHPDDESLIAGGTLALAAAAGARTGVVSLTRGELGPIADPALATGETLGASRERELRAAGSILGVSSTTCLRWPDGELPWIDHDRAADEVAAALEPGLPTAILTFGDDGLYGHPDHAAAGMIASLAAGRAEASSGEEVTVYEAAWLADVVPALVDAVREQGLPADLWGVDPRAFGSDDVRATLVVNVRGVLGRKLAALRAHRTQVGGHHLLASLPDEIADRFLHEERWRLTSERDGRGILERLFDGAHV